MESTDTKKYKAAIIGATGGIGKQLIKSLAQHDRCEKITVLVRRKLEEWDTEEIKAKLNVVECEDMDKMADLKSKFEGHDMFYCCLGTRVGNGKDLFIKVDYQYPLDFAKMAKDVGAKGYILTSSIGADPTAWSLYSKTKGQVEEALKEVGIDNLTILRPGVLKERDADFRFGEWLAGVLPFVPKATCDQVTKCMITNTEEILDSDSTRDPLLLCNKDILKKAQQCKL